MAENQKKIGELNEKIANLEAQVSAAEVEKMEAEKFRASALAQQEETAAEMASIRERLNEAIQGLVSLFLV